MTETNGKDQQNSTNILPPGYTSLTPLLAEKHQDLRYTPLPTYEFAKSPVSYTHLTLPTMCVV